MLLCLFFFKQKTAYELRISDWSSDVCSADLIPALARSETEANRLRCGQAVSMVARADRDRISALSNGSIVFTTSGGKPVALARYEAGDIHPVRVLNL